MLASIALKAILLGQYNDNFFNVMPQLFPYNKFTMSVSRASRVSMSMAVADDAHTETDQADGLAGAHEAAVGAASGAVGRAQGAG